MILLSLIFIGCFVVAYLNYRFWKLSPDLEDDEANAKRRQIEPVIKPTPIPKWDKRMYVIDIILCLVVAGVIVWGILTLLDNYLKH